MTLFLETWMSILNLEYDSNPSSSVYDKRHIVYSRLCHVYITHQGKMKGWD